MEKNKRQSLIGIIIFVGIAVLFWVIYNAKNDWEDKKNSEIKILENQNKELETLKENESLKVDSLYKRISIFIINENHLKDSISKLKTKVIYIKDSIEALPDSSQLKIFNSYTDIEPDRDTTGLVKIPLRQIKVSNIIFTERDYYRSENSLLNDMISLKDSTINYQQEIIISRDSTISIMDEVHKTDQKIITHKEDQNKDLNKKLKRSKTYTLITGAVTVVLFILAALK